ncbi:response regulator transcription factor [Saccharothrix yanglingensis]|uniref:Helix-turn-helix transcriptional regulator n=1 Tax=Saccharothrix yanglingensis TaxID=659496 RepID=A0ABU0XAE2_9PSEU|nr:response regulator transcription factor [Saccharothrix yanglingensis]MDQ2589111.1 helix-turn-helix transcriptional regulator [Saccharothrix yanglingensis]
MRKVKVAVRAEDPLSLAGLIGQLETWPEFELPPGNRWDRAEVMVVAVTALTREVVDGLCRAQATALPVVMVVADLDGADPQTAVECGVVALLPRSAVTTELLVDAVRSAVDTRGTPSANDVEAALWRFERLHRELALPDGGFPRDRLNPREERVMRMLADGLDTTEIAEQLAYSERTVKNIVHGVTTRFGLRNRPHAIAYAVRAGLI